VSRYPVPSHAGIFDPPFGTLWVRGGDAGSETTGPWAFPGMTITLTDTKSGDVLRQKKVHALPCREKPG
jgi:hypothetical protein